MPFIHIDFLPPLSQVNLISASEAFLAPYREPMSRFSKPLTRSQSKILCVDGISVNLLIRSGKGRMRQAVLGVMLMEYRVFVGR